MSDDGYWYEVVYWILTEHEGLKIGVNDIQAPNKTMADTVMQIRLSDEFGDVLLVEKLV